MAAAAGTAAAAQRLGQVLAVLVAGFGVAVLAEYLTGRGLGVDRLLFAGSLPQMGTVLPGRPAPHTALAFLLAGSVLALLDADRRGSYRPAQVLAPLSATVALTAVLGHLYRVAYLITGSTGPGVPVHAAVAFVVLNVGLLLARPDRGVVRTFTSPGPGGLLARRLLPAVLLAPPVAGLLAGLGYRVGWYDVNFRLALTVMTTLACLLGVVSLTVRAIDRAVAARQQAEGQLRASQDRYRMLARNLPNGSVFLFDHDLRYLVADGAGLAEVGLSPELLEGKTIWEALPADTCAVIEPLYRAALAGQPSKQDIPFGGHLYQVHLLPLRGPDGQVEAGMVLTQDVTAQRQAEKALEQARLAAEQANQAKSEYLSRMSHELRTPLNAILGFAQLLQLDELRDDQREGVEHILSGARHLLGLINEVLDIAAIEAGRLPLSLEPVAVAEVVAEAVSLIRPLADQHKVVLVDPAPPCQQHVLADRQRLKQVLLNLLSNAVKYNRAGGSVQLACQRVAGDRLQVRVTDTGLGITPEAQQRLFVPFERLSLEQTAVEGSGLGLALSQRLAEAMGGTLGLVSTVGQGSSFWVELPLADAPDEGAQRQQLPARSQPSQPPPLSPTLTVLYIEGFPTCPASRSCGACGPTPIPPTCRWWSSAPMPGQA